MLQKERKGKDRAKRTRGVIKRMMFGSALGQGQFLRGTPTNEFGVW